MQTPARHHTSDQRPTPPSIISAPYTICSSFATFASLFCHWQLRPPLQSTTSVVETNSTMSSKPPTPRKDFRELPVSERSIWASWAGKHSITSCLTTPVSCSLCSSSSENETPSITCHYRRCSRWVVHLGQIGGEASCREPHADTQYKVHLNAVLDRKHDE